MNVAFGARSWQQGLQLEDSMVTQCTLLYRTLLQTHILFVLQAQNGLNQLGRQGKVAHCNNYDGSLTRQQSRVSVRSCDV